MEYNQMIHVMSSNEKDDRALTDRETQTTAALREEIRFTADWCRRHSVVPVKESWSTFQTHTGHIVEKCAIQWEIDGVRMTDVFWIKRGKRYFGR